ncbi:hypothetical protein M422DRAFT_29528, partial [Sphaerobolus stellatus SS14]
MDPVILRRSASSSVSYSSLAVVDTHPGPAHTFRGSREVFLGLGQTVSIPFVGCILSTPFITITTLLLVLWSRRRRFGQAARPHPSVGCALTICFGFHSGTVSHPHFIPH